MFGGFLDRDVLFHVRTERDQNAHGDGQRVEHLAHGRDHGHPGEVVRVGHQEVGHARQRAGPRDRVDRDNDRQHHQHRHHDPGDALDAVAYARKDDAQREERKQQKANLRRGPVRNEGAEIVILCKALGVAAQILKQILDDPAADDRVVRHDQDRDNGVDPAAKAEKAVFLARLGKAAVGADRTFVGHAAQGGLSHNHRVAEGERQHNINQQENTAAVFSRQVREPPDIAQPHRCPGRRQHKAEFTGEAASVFFFHDFSYFPPHYSFFTRGQVYHIQAQNATPWQQNSPAGQAGLLVSDWCQAVISRHCPDGCSPQHSG